MTEPIPGLADLGWSAFFQSQLDLTELEACRPVRVLAVHRGALEVAGDNGTARIPATLPATAGDWLLIDAETDRPRRLLDRKSVFKRRAAGTGRTEQLIAANIDTLFIVTSCNRDFNIARLERYLALARETEVMPVVVLTKADECPDTGDYRRAAEGLMPGLLVEAVDARDPSMLAGLAAWCGPGQTVALLGSSGVGKSTLINSLTSGEAHLRTAAARYDDDRGRHTTTGRALFPMDAGGWLLDTPGIRELQLVDVETGIETVFNDIMALAATCRFADCAHESEPGCAVQAAIGAGELDPARLDRYRKLAREDRRNRESLAERRARERDFSRMVGSIVRSKNRQKDP